MIAATIEAAVKLDRSIEVMYQMMLGSLYAGLAFSNASLGAVHAMAHSLGGLLDLPHGECNSLLLEHVVALNFDSAPEKYKDIAKAMGVAVTDSDSKETKEKLIWKIRNLRKQLSIGDYALVEEQNDDMIEKLAEGALSDPCIVTNPRMLTQNEVTTIYGEILRKKG